MESKTLTPTVVLFWLNTCQIPSYSDATFKKEIQQNAQNLMSRI